MHLINSVRLLTSANLVVAFFDKKKKNKQKLTFPGDGEALAPQVWEDGLQLFAQIHEIRCDIGVDAESAHFRAGPRILDHQIHLEAQLGHRRFVSTNARVERNVLAGNVRNIVEVRSLFSFLPSPQLTRFRRKSHVVCRGDATAACFYTQSIIHRTYATPSRRRSHFRRLRHRALILNPSIVVSRNFFLFLFRDVDLRFGHVGEKGFLRKLDDFGTR